MMRHLTIAGACKAAVLVGMLSATAAYAQQQNGQVRSPGNPSGSVMPQNPNAGTSNQDSPTGPGGDLSPAKSNCTSATGCANYETGQPTKDNPAQQSMSPGQQNQQMQQNQQKQPKE